MNKYLSKLAVLSILFLSTILFADVASDKASQMKEFSAIMESVQKKIKENPKMSKEEQKELMSKAMDNSKMGKNMLLKQKEQMPKILEILKANRVCLNSANNKKDLKNCEKKSMALAKKLGMEDTHKNIKDDDDFVWDENKKKKIVSQIDQGIKDIELSIPCIEKAKVISDVTKCMQSLKKSAK